MKLHDKTPEEIEKQLKEKVKKAQEAHDKLKEKDK